MPCMVERRVWRGRRWDEGGGGIFVSCAEGEVVRVDGGLGEADDEKICRKFQGWLNSVG